MQAEGF